ncbi:hypothetical protein CABS01_16693 [Colletotrichum abscissum]|uniref:uncharacterized protein n=1 Tax=Colletotrichum abscissum TaxID=1671311 RepID=UPI0027D4F333|nr:uncharacterized protein CABS01_16693 [Colletotrichum abscissum]KAK1515473.1 hypothetical protein CABS01_16693 [Colletotrichum abscissum]
MSTRDTSSLSTPFNPDPSISHLNESLEGIPRYLFRVSDPSALGITTETEVCSEAARISPEHLRDLYQLPSQQAAQLLNTHLWGNCSDSGLDRCNLVSWTSSLLVALQLGFFCHGRSWNPQELSEIKVLVIDTRQFDSRVFARDLQAIAAFKDESEVGTKLRLLYEWRSSGRFYPAEYLSQGKLIISPEKSCQVSMQELVNRGIRNVCSGLGNDAHWDTWAIRIRNLRTELKSQSPPIRSTEVQAAINVAKAFGHFEIPGVIMLLSLTPCDLSSGGAAIVEMLLGAYSKQAVIRHVSFPWFIPGADSERLPELERWRVLSDRIGRHLTLNIDQLALNIDQLRRESEGGDSGHGQADDLASGFAGLAIQSDDVS